LAGQPQEPTWSPHPPAPGQAQGQAYNPPSGGPQSAPPPAAQHPSPPYGYPQPGQPTYTQQGQVYEQQPPPPYGQPALGYNEQTQVYTQGRPQDQGYPQEQQGYPQDQAYPQEQAYQQDQAYQQGQPYQQPQGYPQGQGYPQSQGYPQGQWQGQESADWQLPSAAGPGKKARSPKAPKAPGQGKGFVSSLFDFGFTSFVTPKIIKVLYVLVTIWTILWALAFLDIGFKYGGFGGGLVTLIIIDPIMILLSLGVLRVVLEFFMVTFRMQEDLKALRERGDNSDRSDKSNGSDSAPTPLS
jgi:uncharacterized membrane protein